MEFVVTEDGSDPPGGHDWLAEGGALVGGGREPGPWTAELLEGTTFEVVGLLDRSGSSSRCWEPDGTEMSPPPLFLTAQRLHVPHGYRQVVVAVRRTQGGGLGLEGCLLECDDSLGSGTCGIMDVYGLAPVDVEGHVLFLQGDPEATTLRLSRPLQPAAGAIVSENVSLVPGRHTDCTMKVEAPASQ
jgi:hypothetical protein